MDLGDAASLRLPHATGTSRVRPDHATPGGALRRTAEPQRERDPRAAAQPAVALVPALDHLDCNRPRRARRPPPASCEHTHRGGPRRAVRDPLQRARPVRGPALRAPGRPGVRPLRRRRALRPTGAHLTRAARWLPAGVAAAYLITVAVTAPHIVRLV